MSGNNKILVDTNILLYFLKGNQDVIEMLSGKHIIISFITQLELLSFPKISQKSDNTIRGLLKKLQIVNINDEIKELTIEILKNSKLKLPDAIIGATATYLKLPLLTADDDFEKMKNTEIILYE